MLELDEWKTRCNISCLNKSEFYDAVDKLGLGLGPTFQGTYWNEVLLHYY